VASAILLAISVASARARRPSSPVTIGGRRVLIASTKSLPDAVVYPDSGKMGIWTGNDADPSRVFQIGKAVDYWEGEA